MKSGRRGSTGERRFRSNLERPVRRGPHSREPAPDVRHGPTGMTPRPFGPAWLAPTQAVVMNITDRQDAYVQRVAETLRNQGVRTEVDLRNEKVGFKIRAHTLQRVPYLLVAGDKEVAAAARG